MGVAAPEIHRPDLPTTSAPPSGHNGAVLSPGDHICCFYTGSDQRDRIVLPFLRAGVQHGDKCFCLIDSTDPDLVRRRVEAPSAAGPDQLVVELATETYLWQGRFSGGRMIKFFDERIGTAVRTACFPSVRAVGEMSWVLRDPPGGDELFGYEAAINAFAPRYPQALLCLYDVRRFGAAMLVDAVMTHPKVLIGNLLVENSWCKLAHQRSVSGADPGGLCEHQGGAE